MAIATTQENWISTGFYNIRGANVLFSQIIYDVSHHQSYNHTQTYDKTNVVVEYFEMIIFSLSFNRCHLYVQVDIIFSSAAIHGIQIHTNQQINNQWIVFDLSRHVL